MRLNTLILDTNVLVLLLVGFVDEDAIEIHRRTRVYDASAYRILIQLVQKADLLATTPHVLTETSNLIRQCGEPLRTYVTKAFEAFVAEAEETAEGARLLVGRPEHARLGLTDAGVLNLQAPGTALLTDDNALYFASLTAGYEAINFTHLRNLG